MKTANEILEMIGEISKASLGQEIQLTLNDVDIKTLKEICKFHNSVLEEPNAVFKCFTTYLIWDNVTVFLNGKKLKQVTTFETI